MAFNLNKYGTKTKAREKIDALLNSGLIKEGQPVLCAFGEIDIRVHVLLEAERQRKNFKFIIDDILSNYLNFLKFLSKGRCVYAWGPVPSQKDGSAVNPDFPYYGAETARNIATEYFNERLKTECLKNGIKYLSVFKYLIDDKYRTKAQYIADGCHLSQKVWIFAAEEFRAQNIKIIFNGKWIENFVNTLKNENKITRKIRRILGRIKNYMLK